MYAKLALAAALALAALAAASASQPEGDRASGTASAVRTTTERAPGAERQERLICRRVGLTGQPTSNRRVCLTGEQWRQIDDGE
jgi:hypothetical protein